MRVLVRTDASNAMGAGHVMRCLSLAKRLRKRGAYVTFMSVEVQGNLFETIERSGFDLIPIAANAALDVGVARGAVDRAGGADLIIVDHYRLNRVWETALRRTGARMMAIDDLADRDHDCDYLLDQNPHENEETRYQGRTPSSCRFFLGPRYALLGEPFDNPALRRKRDGRLRRLFVCMGGSDPTNETAKVLTAVSKMGAGNSLGAAIDIVVGAAYAHFEEIEKASSMLPGVRLYRQSNDVARLLSECDLAVGSCGTMSWERCALGVPAIAITTADNQLDTARALQNAGAIRWLGSSTEVDCETIEKNLLALSGDADGLVAMGKAASGIMAGAASSELVDALMVG